MHTSYLVAHRGYSSKYGDNTSKSFEQAILKGATMIETDLRLSLDGVWVLSHDPIYPCGSLEVCQVPASARPSGILTLKEGLDLIGGRVPVYLDIKGHPTKNELKSLIDLLDALSTTEESRWSLHKFWLASFNHVTVRTLLKIRRKSASKQLPQIGFIGPIQPVNMRSVYRGVPRSANLRGIDFVATEMDLVDQAYIHFVQIKRGLKLFVYTLNTSFSLHHYHNCGVDGLLTDNVALFKTTLNI